MEGFIMGCIEGCIGDASWDSKKNRFQIELELLP